MAWTKAKPDVKGIMQRGRGDVTIGNARVAAIAARYGSTEVVLSFGSADGGAKFAKWLRWNLMRRLGLKQINSVYLDTVALAQVPETQFKEIGVGTPWYNATASMNGGWHGYYRHAVAQARAMIFVGTPAWQTSMWCQGELRDFQNENRDRKRRGAAPVHGVNIAFADMPVINIPDTKLVVCARSRGISSLDNIYNISPTDIDRVLAAARLL
jgi:hypothetical protein